MTAKVIHLRPHKPVADARRDIIAVIELIRQKGEGHLMKPIELSLCKIADDLLDYVETQQGR